VSLTTCKSLLRVGVSIINLSFDSRIYFVNVQLHSNRSNISLQLWVFHLSGDTDGLHPKNGKAGDIIHEENGMYMYNTVPATGEKFEIELYARVVLFKLKLSC